MILALAITIGSALLGAGVVFKHQRLLTFLAAAGALAQGQWLLLTLLDRTLLVQIDSLLVFTGGAILLAIVWGLFWRQWRFPLWRTTEDLWRDGVVLLALIPVLASAWLIASTNGWQEDGSWRTHGFYNGDSVTFGALVQKSFLSAGLVNENPFAGNGDLEYPTLLHAGVAELVATMVPPDVAQGAGWLSLWPLLIYLGIGITVPLFFLLWDVLVPQPAEAWKEWLGTTSRPRAYLMQAIVILFVLALSWESYVYPQGHFFLMGLFLLVVAALSLAAKQAGRAQWLPVAVAEVAVLGLVFSNAVTGTAAVGVLLLFFMQQALNRKQVVSHRAMYLIAVPIWVSIFFLASPGNGAIGGLGFSYTASFDMLRLLVPLALVMIGLLWHLSRFSFTAAAVAGLSGLAFITYFFSTRDIVVANASRFFYHAVLVGFPLLVYPVLRSWFWLRRELLHTTHTVVERLAGWGSVITLILLLLLPAAASLASTHDNLLRLNAHQLTEDDIGALQFIAEHLPADTRVLASPDEPWGVPLFTGRALVRTAYWLSPGDELETQVVAAFAGDEAAQQAVLQEADVLLLRGSQHSEWDVVSYPILFSNEQVSMWQVGN